MIETILAHLTAVGDLDDPLLRFAAQLENNTLDGTTETVNLGSLFSCQGAVVDALEVSQQTAGCLVQRQANAAVIAEVARASGWKPLLPTDPFRTGILLLQAEREVTRQRSGQDLRSLFCELGIAL